MRRKRDEEPAHTAPGNVAHSEAWHRRLRRAEPRCAARHLQRRARLRLLSLSCTTAFLLAPRTAAPGEAPSASGFEFAFRSGFVIPAGNATTDGALSNGVGIQIPLVGDVGYRLNEHFFVGVTGQYAFDTRGNGGCAFDPNCSAHDARVGAEVELHPRGRAALDPWLGVGFGYEWLSSRTMAFGSTQSMTFRGFDFLVVDIGLDFPLGKFRIGPFAGFALGQFDHATDRGDGSNPTSFPLDAKTLHYWLSVGVKLTFSP